MEYFLLSSVGGFKARHKQLWQIVLSKGRATALPARVVGPRLADRQPNPLDQVVEARVAAQRVDAGIDSEEREPVVAPLVGPLEPVERVVRFLERGAQQRQRVRRCPRGAGLLDQLDEDAPGLQMRPPRA